jgi:hypothetical protein
MECQEPKGKRSLGTPRHWWEDNIRMGHKETGWKGAGWIHLDQDTDLWPCGNEPSSSTKGREFFNKLSIY